MIDLENCDRFRTLINTDMFKEVKYFPKESAGDSLKDTRYCMKLSRMTVVDYHRLVLLHKSLIVVQV